MMDPESHMSALGLLEAVFPSLPRVVLYAALEVANGSLEGAVTLLIESGAQLSDEFEGDEGGGGAPTGDAGAGAGASNDDEEEVLAALSAMQQHMHAEGGGSAGFGPPVGAAPPSGEEEAGDNREEDDHVLAITVPQGCRPNALLKITTTIGTVHARVPPGVPPGSTFFIRMRRGNPFAPPST